jgi:membrane protease YdiL (CAAX protease family)
MTKFVEWLREEPKGVGLVGYVLLAGLVTLSIDYTVLTALENWGLIPHLPNERGYVDGYMVAQYLVVGPILEEMTMRFLPLAVLIAFLSDSPRVAFACAIGFAVLFGAIHPHTPHMKALHAAAGLTFGLVFLKCGGLNRHFLRGTAAAIAAHSVSNGFTFLAATWVY